MSGKIASALPYYRNAIVHPMRRNEFYADIKALREISNLGLFLLDLGILKLVRYAGILHLPKNLLKKGLLTFPFYAPWVIFKSKK